MDTYKIEKLIFYNPDQELLAFYKFVYNIKYRCINPFIEDTESCNVIELYKIYYDLDLTPEDLIAKPRYKAILTESWFLKIISNKRDLLKLINYDENVLRRVSSMYNITINDLVGSIIFDTLFTNYVPVSPVYHNDCYNNSVAVKEEDIPNDKPNINVFVVTDEVFFIPETVTSLTINYILSTFILPKSLLYLSTDNIEVKVKLPKGLITLSIDIIDDGYGDHQLKLPKKLKALTNKNREYYNIPKNIEYLEVEEIYHDEYFPKLKCSKVKSLNNDVNLDEVCPNLEALTITHGSRLVYDLPKLKFLSVKNINVAETIPANVIFIQAEYINKKKIPKSVKVLVLKTVDYKYNNVECIQTINIKKKYIPDNIKMLIVSDNLETSKTTNKDVIFINDERTNVYDFIEEDDEIY